MPATSPASWSTRNLGTGTLRDWCVFGVLKTRAPRTFGYRFDDLRPPPKQIQTPYPQRGQLTPTQSGVREEQHGGARVAGGRSQGLDLVMREDHFLAFGGTGQWDAISGIADQPAVAHGEVEDEREHPMGLADGRGRQTGGGQVCDPGCDALVRHVGQRDAPPPRQDVDPQQTLVADAGGRLQVDLGREPSVGPVVHADLRATRIDIRSARHRRRHLVQPPLGVDLPVEVARMLCARGVAVARTPAPVRPASDVRHGHSFGRVGSDTCRKARRPDS